MAIEQQTCACGCGKPVHKRDGVGRPSKYFDDNCRKRVRQIRGDDRTIMNMQDSIILEDDQGIYTTEDVAKKLKVGVETIRRLINRRELQCFRVGSEYRFTEQDVQAFIEQNRVAKQEEVSA